MKEQEPKSRERNEIFESEMVEEAFERIAHDHNLGSTLVTGHKREYFKAAAALAIKLAGERVSGETPKPDLLKDLLTKALLDASGDTFKKQDGTYMMRVFGIYRDEWFKENALEIQAVSGEAKTPDQSITLPKTCLDVFKNISKHLTYSETAALIQFLKESQMPKGVELTGGSVPIPSDETGQK